MARGAALITILFARESQATAAYQFYGHQALIAPVCMGVALTLFFYAIVAVSYPGVTRSFHQPPVYLHLLRPTPDIRGLCIFFLVHGV